MLSNAYQKPGDPMLTGVHKMTRIESLACAVLLTLSTVLAGCTVGDVLTPSWGDSNSAPEEAQDKDRENHQR